LGLVAERWYKLVERGNVHLLGPARELRKHATKQENHLWYDFLKKRPEQWYRQRVIGNFIVDFYCPSAKFVVELDGMHHSLPQQQSYDEERDAYLSALGLQILRYQNHEIDHDFFRVCEQIASISISRQQSPRLLPREGAPARGPRKCLHLWGGYAAGEEGSRSD